VKQSATIVCQARSFAPSAVQNTAPSQIPPHPIQDHVPPPCFFWNLCAARAAMEKAGRSVCKGCSARLRGAEYPVRAPSPESLYLTGRVAAEALDMVD
jgi:hypothetical protein